MSKLQGSRKASLPGVSPYVFSQMLVPLEMLCCGILMGIVALVAEVKRCKEWRWEGYVESANHFDWGPKSNLLEQCGCYISGTPRGYSFQNLLHIILSPSTHNCLDEPLLDGLTFPVPSPSLPVRVAGYHVIVINLKPNVCGKWFSRKCLTLFLLFEADWLAQISTHNMRTFMK